MTVSNLPLVSETVSLTVSDTKVPVSKIRKSKAQKVTIPTEVVIDNSAEMVIDDSVEVVIETPKLLSSEDSLISKIIAKVRENQYNITVEQIGTCDISKRFILNDNVMVSLTKSQDRVTHTLSINSQSFRGRLVRRLMKVVVSKVSGVAKQGSKKVAKTTEEIESLLSLI